MARSYSPPRNASAAFPASRHVAGDPSRPFHSLIGRETTFAIPGFPSRSSANRVSTAQWISADGAALRRYVTAGSACTTSPIAESLTIRILRTSGTCC